MTALEIAVVAGCVLGAGGAILFALWRDHVDAVQARSDEFMYGWTPEQAARLTMAMADIAVSAAETAQAIGDVLRPAFVRVGEAMAALADAWDEAVTQARYAGESDLAWWHRQIDRVKRETR